MNTAEHRTIDLCPYLPATKAKKSTSGFRQVLQVISLLIDGIATVGIGVCLLTGIHVFLTIA